MTSSTRSEQERFETAAVPKTIVRVAAHQQESAQTLVRRGWMAFGHTEIELIARPRRAHNGGRVFGDVLREDEDVAA